MPVQVAKMMQGDLRPVIQSTLMSNGSPIDLTGAEDTTYLIYRHRILRLDYTAKATVLDALNAIVEYDWQAGDTDIPGTYDLSWRSVDPAGRPITVPNDRYDRLEIRRSIPYGPDTFDFVGRLRQRMADDEGDLYPDDLWLIMAMHKASLELKENLRLSDDDLTFLTDDVNDPLQTSRDLKDYEADLWVLFAARTLLRAEHLAAARRSAILRSQASRVDMSKVPANIMESLQEVEDSIIERMEEAGMGLGPPRFLDVYLTERRFINENRMGLWPGWATIIRTWPTELAPVA